MNSSSPRVVIVGCGGIARAHISAISSAHIVALCDSNIGSARRVSQESELDVPVFESLESAIQFQSPTVAVICTPPATHFELVRLALEAGVDVLCEKPLALSANEAYGLVSGARERKLILRTSAKYRFCEGVQAAKALLAGGETGILQRVSVAFGASFDFKRSWHADTTLSGGGVWMDNGPHALDLARYFVGELHLGALEEWQTEDELETEGHVRLRSEGDVPVNIVLSWKRSLGEHFVVLQCQRGSIEIGWSETVWRSDDGETRRLAGAYDKTACFAAQWQGFLHNDARLTSADGVRAVELIEAIYQAASQIRGACSAIA